MLALITLSHVVNIIVAGTVGYLLLRNSQRMDTVFGPASPARSILASVYIAIATTSAVAVLVPMLSITIAMVLFPLQIFYKLTTPLSVGTLRHPVVISNLLISLLHAWSLFFIFMR